MSEKMFENWGSKGLEMMIKDYDETPMPLPSVETEPQLLISKVRKHYMEHMIQLLSNNYETHQKLLGKNIYLPSAIWRCAKYIELNAAQTCMVVELYRRNIIAVVKQLKADTKKGKLNRMLLECLQKPPVNEKKLQATLGKQSNCTCQCTCNGTTQKKRKLSTSPRKSLSETDGNVSNSQVLNTTHSQTPADNRSYNITITSNEISQMYPPQNKPCTEPPIVSQPAINPSSKILPIPRISIESQDSEDQVMLQLEQLFRADSNEIEDDLFESTLFETVDSNDHHDNVLNILNASVETPVKNDEQAAKIKSLDERLALLESSGVLVTTNAPKTDTAEVEKTSVEPPQKKKKTSQAKWMCELYYQRMYLFEKLDDIRESNRKKHSRIKGKFLELFGDDSDNEDDQIMSPLEETPEFVLSCKERIAPWIVKLLTPYYVSGRIRGKALFKAVAKHLIRLIYQCSRYPSQFEVTSFVTDFLKSHKMIRCEADFKEFRIDNI